MSDGTVNSGTGPTVKVTIEFTVPAIRPGRGTAWWADGHVDEVVAREFGGSDVSVTVTSASGRPAF